MTATDSSDGFTATPGARRPWIYWTGLAVAVLLACGVAGAVALKRYMSGELRRRAIALLEERLQSKVELADLQIALGPVIAIAGSGFVVRHHGRTDVPPLVSIASFSADVPWTGLFAAPRRVTAVEIRGLRISTPPGENGVRDKEGGGCKDRQASAPPPPEPEPSPFLIDRLTSRDATLTLLPSRPDKNPRVFAIDTVTLDGFALDRPARFTATLTNPIPRGTIDTHGTFGPWEPRAPSQTPVEGEYRFSKADMGTIDGIAGELDSTGRFEGPLQQIIVKGETRVANFGLTTSRNRMPLQTRFEACVDGTDGDTYLDRVEATLQDTPIVAAGRVEGTVGVQGRTIALDVTVDDGRIEDFLRLAVNDETPLMKGRIDVKSSFVLPPGKGEVVERLDLDGQFTLRDARFSEGRVQGKINELSRRGRGDMDSAKATPVRSALGGRFSLSRSTLHLSRFSFAVPGAVVQLEGRYGLKSEALDFSGRVRTEARVSEMTTGFKSGLLKVIDPLFARDGAGAVFPISITGTRESPSMKVDVKRAIFGGE